MLLLAVSACLLAQGFALEIGFGTCQDKPVQQNFNVGSYMGQWFQNERYWQIHEIAGKCSKAVYTLDKVSGKVLVKNTQINTWTNKENSIEGFAVQSSPNEGKLNVTLNTPVVGPRTAPLWVLETDYTSYSLAYSCTKFGPVKYESAWVLTRAANPDEATKEKIEAAIKKSGLPRKSFTPTVQDC